MWALHGRPSRDGRRAGSTALALKKRSSSIRRDEKSFLGRALCHDAAVRKQRDMAGDLERRRHRSRKADALCHTPERASGSR